MDLVEEAEEELLALRDRYAETMAARDRMRYEREFCEGGSSGGCRRWWRGASTSGRWIRILTSEM